METATEAMPMVGDLWDLQEENEFAPQRVRVIDILTPEEGLFGGSVMFTSYQSEFTPIHLWPVSDFVRFAIKVNPEVEASKEFYF